MIFVVATDSWNFIPPYNKMNIYEGICMLTLKSLIRCWLLSQSIEDNKEEKENNKRIERFLRIF